MFLPLEEGFPVDYRNQDTISNQVIDWGVHATHAEDAWKRTRGEGINVGVLDTGWTDHPDISPNAVHCPLLGIAPPDRGDGFDTRGHGTHVAGIIGALDNDRGVVGVAPGVLLHLYPCLPGGPEHIAAALRAAILDGVDICNISGGTYEDHSEVRQAVIDAHAAGIVLVASAGNDPTRGVAYPAAYPEVIAVSALTEEMKRADFAPLTFNHVALPGVSILSTWLDSKYARLSGTSQAAPLLTGVIALMLALYRPTRDVVHQTVAAQLTRIACQSADLLYTSPDLEKL